MYQFIVYLHNQFIINIPIHCVSQLLMKQHGHFSKRVIACFGFTVACLSQKLYQVDQLKEDYGVGFICILRSTSSCTTFILGFTLPYFMTNLPYLQYLTLFHYITIAIFSYLICIIVPSFTYLTAFHGLTSHDASL